MSNETLGDYLARNVGSHVQIALARTKEEPLSIMGGNVIRLEDGRLSIEVDAWPWEQLGEEERTVPFVMTFVSGTEDIAGAADE